MSRPEHFTIDKVSWHTGVKGNPETPAKVRQRFRIIADFLQENGLVTRTLLRPGEEPGNEFEIHTSDLTDEGLEVMHKGYDEWCGRVVDRRKDLTDLRILVEALREVRKA
jgi:hypothetical protein